ncbi:unnamed protein product, partial [Prorocentrum cordatum]
GTVEVVVSRCPSAAKVPAVLVSVGCYGTLAETLGAAEGPGYAAEGYAYVITRAVGSREEIADAVFTRWRADQAAVLDWLGAQPWCNGRVGTHGFSLLSNCAYAALAASRDKSAPDTRAQVVALVPAISFSRIQPTVYLWGQGLAAELALRFLWLAEVGLRPSDGGGFSLKVAWGTFAFFALAEWPGLLGALAGRPVAAADQAMWGRPNRLWQEGQVCREPDSPLWAGGADVQCDLLSLGARCPPIHGRRIIAGWHDMFLRQSLDDFAAAAQASQGAETRDGACAREQAE